MTEFVSCTCAKCGEVFGLALGTEKALRHSEAGFHCPWGHELVFHLGESETDKLRRERDRLKQQAARLLEEADDWRKAAQGAQRQAAAARGQITKLKKRAAAGVCPCCNRRFVALAAHMEKKHPGFVAEPLDQDKAAA